MTSWLRSSLRSSTDASLRSHSSFDTFFLLAACVPHAHKMNLSSTCHCMQFVVSEHVRQRPLPTEGEVNLFRKHSPRHDPWQPLSRVSCQRLAETLIFRRVWQ